MAGMPPSLLERAHEVLRELENQRAGKNEIKDSLKQLPERKMQLNIFDAHSETFEEIRRLLTDMDINRLTPVEALLKLQEIKSKIR
jgi:DNA mismatch repair protein MutS